MVYVGGKRRGERAVCERVWDQPTTSRRQIFTSYSIQHHKEETRLLNGHERGVGEENARSSCGVLEREAEVMAVGRTRRTATCLFATLYARFLLRACGQASMQLCNVKAVLEMHTLLV